jgi:hypothetical protein
MDAWVSEWSEKRLTFSGAPRDHIKLILSTGAAATTILSTSGLWTVLPSVAAFVRGPDQTSTAVTTSTGARLAANERGYTYVDFGQERFISLLGTGVGSAYCDRLRGP